MIGVVKIGTRASRGGGGAPSVNPDFVSTWDTTQAGSASDTVVLPLLSGGTYSGTIDWGDGNSDSLSYANRTHVYASSGTYTITIIGSDIQGWRFAGGGDKSKITDVSNWGNLTITTDQAFFGCDNLDVSATDAPTIATTDITYMFRNCQMGAADLSAFDVSGVQRFQGCFQGAFFTGDVSTWDMTGATNPFALREMFYLARVFNGDITGWDVSNVTNFSSMFYGARTFNQPIGSWDMSSATDLSQMLRYQRISYVFDQDISSWDISGVTNLTNFMAGVTSFSTTNYDLLLVGWEATLQAAYPSGVGYPATINVNFGSSQYTSGSAAATARASLISTFGWTITDGGAV